MSKYILIFLFLVSPISTLLAKDELPFDKDYAYELLRYLYRWHMDDAILAESGLKKLNHIDILYRPMSPQLDEHDESKFLEVIIPVARLVVTLKKADYTIDKLNISVKNKYYKVQSAQFYKNGIWDLSMYKKYPLEHENLFEYLYHTRNERSYPDKKTLDKLRKMVIKSLYEEGYSKKEVELPKETIFIAPITITSNDIWVYWMEGHKFIHLSADLNCANEYFWQVSSLKLEIIDADEEVVISPLEKDQSLYFTKDYIGRVLFNCVILGQRLITISEKPQS